MRVLSLVIALGYLVVSVVGSQPKSVKEAVGVVLLISVVLLFPLACIWFGDELGNYVGMLPGPNISKRSPGGLVKLGGWILLMLPLVFYWFTFKS